MEKLISISDLNSGDRRAVFVDDTPALVIRYADQYFVIEDVCSHDGQPLTSGEVADFSIICPRHGARFDLRTGKALCMPATKPIRTFHAEIRDGFIWAGDAEDPSVGNDDSVKSTEQDLIDALKQVIDPELMINIVDLGLVYAISQEEENDRRVSVEMTLTSPACPAGPQIVQQAKMALERLSDVDEAKITLTMTPPWSPDRMTDDARDQLGIF